MNFLIKKNMVDGKENSDKNRSNSKIVILYFVITITVLLSIGVFIKNQQPDFLSHFSGNTSIFMLVGCAIVLGGIIILRQLNLNKKKKKRVLYSIKEQIRNNSGY